MKNISDWSLSDSDKLYNYLGSHGFRSEKYKLLYVATPKVACTSLKWWFADLEGYTKDLREVTDSSETDPDLIIHDSFHKVAPHITWLAPVELLKTVADDSYFKFAVVRNPYKRIFSAWQSKLLLQEPLQVTPYINCCFYSQVIERDEDVASAFEGFLEHLEKHEVPNYLDIHWTPQVSLLRPDLITYSKIVKIEAPGELSAALSERLGSDFVDPFAVRRTNESLIPYLPKYITARSAELICSMYADDFETFGYDKSPPDGKDTFTADQLSLAIRGISMIRARHRRFGEIYSHLQHQNKFTQNQIQTISELQKNVSDITAANAWLASQLDAWEKAVAEKDLLLSNIGCEVSALRAELKLLTQSRLFRLRSAIVSSPFNFEKVVRVCYLLISIITPAIFRSGARSLVSKLKSSFIKCRQTPPAINTVDAYLVKQPASTNNRLRVVHVIANFMTGGSSRLVVDIYEHMGESFEQSIITSYAPNPPAYIGIDVDEIRSPQSEQPFVARLKLIKPDLIHLHYWGDCDEPWYAKAVCAAELLNIPVVQNINTPISPYVSGSIKRYVYVSDYVRHVFGADESSHITVYPGSDFTLFESQAASVSTEDWIGMVYRLETDKLNADSIIPFILAVQKRPQTHVLIVGGGSLMEPFQRAVELAGVSNNFEFTGYVPYSALPDLYRRMKLFVAPVWKESFGQVSPFAMNMRVPVVGFDIGAIGEIVEDTSLLAPYGGAAALSDIIVSLLDDTPRRLEIAERQHNRAQASFSVQAMIAGYRDIYTAVTQEAYK